jgi:hypothetical protein
MSGLGTLTAKDLVARGQSAGSK